MKSYINYTNLEPIIDNNLIHSTPLAKDHKELYDKYLNENLNFNRLVYRVIKRMTIRYNGVTHSGIAQFIDSNINLKSNDLEKHVSKSIVLLSDLGYVTSYEKKYSSKYNARSVFTYYKAIK